MMVKVLWQRIVALHEPPLMMMVMMMIKFFGGNKMWVFFSFPQRKKIMFVRMEYN